MVVGAFGGIAVFIGLKKIKLALTAYGRAVAEFLSLFSRRPEELPHIPFKGTAAGTANEKKGGLRSGPPEKTMNFTETV